ncbi:MAG: redoxin domain-containing protein [Planctomycetia bacterium]|nr:redoxin domain-containing protein [Planctomycetia bacterium]
MAIASLRRLCGTLAVLATAAGTVYAGPTVEDALKLKPTQKDVEYVTPEKADIEGCTIKAEKTGGQTGWVIRDKAGQVLRRFLDTNADNVVDQWSYFLDGLEVYRDIDSDFNGKQDQHRWFNTAGMRWGVDTNEDGKIDYWKAISAEEVSAEIVAALADRDAARFARLVLSSEEVKTLGLSDARVKDIATKAAGATEEFRKVATGTKTLTSASRWLQFGGTRPGVVPVGTDGSTQDLTVFENGVAVVQTGEKTAQLQIGTMIRVGDAWRLIGAPGIVGENEVLGYFFTARNAERTEEGNATNPAGGPPQPLLSKLDQIDKELEQTANPQQQAKLTADKAAVIEQIVEAVNSADDRALWTRQLADMISAAVQSNVWPEGVEKLKTLYMSLAKDPAGEELAAYVEFRYLTAEYGRALSSGAPFDKVQANWLASLEKYVQDRPKSADTAEAMLQLAIAQEFAGQEAEAKTWYGQIRDRFSDSPTAKKAAGALTRLDSVGKVIRLRGTNVADRKPIDLAQFKDKVVLIQYWATWCEPAKIDLAQIKEMQAKYGKDGLAILGVSLDAKPEDLVDYLKQNRLPWPQIFEPGGLDSRLANEMGILTLPTMILVGKDGRVVNRGIHITELEREVGNLLSTPQAKK